MTFQVYIKQPMQMVEFKLKISIDNVSHLINTLDRTAVNHPLMRKSSNIPFC